MSPIKSVVRYKTMKWIVTSLLSLYLGLGVALLHYLYFWYARHYHDRLRCSFPGIPTIYWQPFSKAVWWVIPNALLCLIVAFPLSCSIALSPSSYPLAAQRLFTSGCFLALLFIASTVLSQLTTSASISKIVITAFLFIGYGIAISPYFGFKTSAYVSSWLGLFGLFVTFALAWIPGTKGAYKMKQGQGTFPEGAFMMASAFFIIGGGAFLNGVIHFWGN